MKKLPSIVAADLKNRIISTPNENTILLSKYIEHHQFDNYSEYMQQHNLSSIEINDLFLLAVCLGNHHIAKDLMHNHGATSHKMYRHLQSAIELQHIELIQLILQHPLYNEHAPIHKQDLQEETINMLSEIVGMEKDEGHDTKTIKTAVHTNNIDILKMVLEKITNFDIHKVLASACRRGAGDMFDYLVNRFQPDLQQQNYLYLVLKGKEPHKADRIRYMVDKYAIDINKIYTEEVRIRKPTSLFHLYNVNENTEVEIQTNVSTILSEACNKNEVEVVNYLLHAGADFHLANDIAFEKCINKPQLMKHLIIEHNIQQTKKIYEILVKYNLHDILHLFATRDLANQMRRDLPLTTCKATRNKI